MNKFLVVLLLIGTCFSFRFRDVPIDTIYDAVVAFAKGMAETEEATCAGVLEKHKDEIIKIVQDAIDEVKAGTDISVAIQNAALKLMGIDGFVAECNILALPAVVTKITSKEGLVEIFQTAIDNIDSIYDWGQKAFEALKNKDYNTAAFNGGKILSTVLDFHVNY